MPFAGKLYIDAFDVDDYHNVKPAVCAVALSNAPHRSALLAQLSIEIRRCRHRCLDVSTTISDDNSWMKCRETNCVFFVYGKKGFVILRLDDGDGIIASVVIAMSCVHAQTIRVNTNGLLVGEV